MQSLTSHTKNVAMVAVRARSRPARRSAVLAAVTASLLVLMLSSAALVYANASHDGWPTNDCQWRNRTDPGPGCGVYKSHPDGENGNIQGTDLSDELLGEHGNDTIYGGPAGDVIWGDFRPCCQPTDQHDSLRGGSGKDFIYASHGTNNIDAGPGNDVVHAHFGRRGTIDCGSGKDTLFLSHKSERHYGVRNCEKITFAHEGA